MPPLSTTKDSHDKDPQLSLAAESLEAVTVSDLFRREPSRVKEFRCAGAGLTLDYSKHRLSSEARRRLFELAREQELSEAFDDLIRGKPVNITEERPALHTLLRGTNRDLLPDYYVDVDAALQGMKKLVEAVHGGVRVGFSGKPFTDVVNIGIGGSDLGPRMICRALHDPAPELYPHFVANVDPQDLDEVLAPLNPETTLFVVCSKSFTTEETLTNALRARAWLITAGAAEADIERHVVAVTTNIPAAAEFGIAPSECFPMWDWVGGRYSLWSAIGLVIALHRGWSVFEAVLAGGKAMDQHTQEAAPEQNLPMVMALLEHWNTQYLGTDSHLVLPYSQRLAEFPDFLQQLTMESNGKRATLSGDEVSSPTAPVLWGSAGTIGQHSYYQMLHQGNRRFAADIILPLTNQDVDHDAHCKLAANALAQSRALMIGRSAEEARALVSARGQPVELAKHFEMPGSHPTSLLTCHTVSPEILGALVAAYEHKTYFLSRLLNINAFDQWGVELGKVIGRQIRHSLESGSGLDELDPSTVHAIELWRSANTR